MANLDFTIDGPPILDDACTYCGTPIREKHIKLTFQWAKIRLHIEPCWDQFVVGVSIINDKLMERIIN